MARFRNFSDSISISEHNAKGVDATHRHRNAYAAIVCEGAYQEISADGPVHVSAGDIVIHPPFHQHKNLFASSNVKVLNLTLPFEPACHAGYGVLHGGASFIVKLVGNHQERAVEHILDRADGAKQTFPSRIAALDMAAGALRDDPFLPISAIANRAGYTHAYFTRAFTRYYGVSPASFRAEYRFRRAVNCILVSKALADAASDAGYADQAHMTRDFRRRTGVTPATLGREVKFVQDEDPAR